MRDMYRESYDSPHQSFASVYEYPVEEIERAEGERVMKKIMSMKALHLHNSNFEVLKGVYGAQAVSSKAKFEKLLFTYEDT